MNTMKPPRDFDTLIVPGYNGSGDAHWQTWFEQQLPHAYRVEGIDWAHPRIAVWGERIAQTLLSARRPVWLVAHSFGCLASVWAARNPAVAGKVAGAFLVAPADPWRFSHDGLISNIQPDRGTGVGSHKPFPTAEPISIAHDMPRDGLPFPSVVIASSNDPWVRFTTAAQWAQHWGGYLMHIGEAGHINIDSGFGAWDEGLKLFEDVRAVYADLPNGELDGGLGTPRALDKTTRVAQLIAQRFPKKSMSVHAH